MRVPWISIETSRLNVYLETDTTTTVRDDCRDLTINRARAYLELTLAALTMSDMPASEGMVFRHARTDNTPLPMCYLKGPQGATSH